ncbi:serine/threonine protein kinase [Waterburya agarophytonicola K14]|uniref:Serine/threonine protein kinase n=1 Tax=Waterburya agarophytonicola KI4 TaxID=2874699 RepID=A0A964BS88_9CYAN|nr:serine/threonine-protein kinase [Waterburya agarophytonicola]MCC0177301.1 serine/threonine protein kinase [Waterburya agarophytonicola KI4]
MLTKPEYPTLETICRYRQEYEIIKSLKHPYIIKAYELIHCDRRLAIVFENCQAKSLRDSLEERKFALEEILNFGIKAIDALNIVHQANVIHKDINPSNFLFNRHTGVLKLIDFDIATQLSKEQKSIQNYQSLEGTLAYISPEQTRRMNRSLDYRSDYYSLGVTLYELLTQRLPFNIQEPRSLIYSHLVKITLFCHSPKTIVISRFCNPCLISDYFIIS